MQRERRRSDFVAGVMWPVPVEGACREVVVTHDVELQRGVIDRKVILCLRSGVTKLPFHRLFQRTTMIIELCGKNPKTIPWYVL